jgi:hypothetical protein
MDLQVHTHKMNSLPVPTQGTPLASPSPYRREQLRSTNFERTGILLAPPSHVKCSVDRGRPFQGSALIEVTFCFRAVRLCWRYGSTSTLDRYNVSETHLQGYAFDTTDVCLAYHLLLRLPSFDTCVPNVCVPRSRGVHAVRGVSCCLQLVPGFPFTILCSHPMQFLNGECVAFASGTSRDTLAIATLAKPNICVGLPARSVAIFCVHRKVGRLLCFCGWPRCGDGARWSKDHSHIYRMVCDIGSTFEWRTADVAESETQSRQGGPCV